MSARPSDAYQGTGKLENQRRYPSAIGPLLGLKKAIPMTAPRLRRDASTEDQSYASNLTDEEEPSGADDRLPLGPGSHYVVPVTTEAELQRHSEGRPGKLAITLTRLLITSRDLSRAYSPGVAGPCLAIPADPAVPAAVAKAAAESGPEKLIEIMPMNTTVSAIVNVAALAAHDAQVDETSAAAEQHPTNEDRQ